ncbi:hypothetical protein [Lentzea sp. NPDC003310]|uniref:hypothetical protein n=1 Tax=Lentzea sp. NPDC003310 TaxID=3154447 RepID=UPI0033AEDE39
MADFFLESPESLGKLTDQLRRAGEDGANGQKHVKQYGDLTLPEEGLLLDTFASHEHAYGLVHGAMQAIAIRGQYSAEAIDQTVDAFMREDARVRASLDKAFHALDGSAPRPDFSPYEVNRRGAAFSDGAEPSDNFTQPQRPRDDGPLFKFDPSSDVFSPTAVLRGVCVEVAGRDPFEAMVRWLSGDWVAYHRCVTVWRQVGTACEQIGANIGRAGADMDAVWRGNAADQAGQYLSILARAVTDFAPICVTLAEHYEAGVQAAQKFNEALAGIAAGISDMANAWLLSTIAISLGVDNDWLTRRAAVALIAFYASQIIELVAEAMSLWGQAKDRAAGILGAIKTVEFGRLRDLRPPTVLLSPGSPQ